MPVLNKFKDYIRDIHFNNAKNILHLDADDLLLDKLGFIKEDIEGYFHDFIDNGATVEINPKHNYDYDKKENKGFFEILINFNEPKWNLNREDKYQNMLKVLLSQLYTRMDSNNETKIKDASYKIEYKKSKWYTINPSTFTIQNSIMISPGWRDSYEIRIQKYSDKLNGPNRILSLEIKIITNPIYGK